MAKAAHKKKASSAHRKVQSSTARSRKNVKRTNSSKKTVGSKKVAEAVAKAEAKVETKQETNTPEIILHTSKRVDLLEREIAQTVETIVPSKKEVILETSLLVNEPKTEMESISDTLEAVVGSQQVAPQQLALQPTVQPRHMIQVTEVAEETQALASTTLPQPTTQSTVQPVQPVIQSQAADQPQSGSEPQPSGRSRLSAKEQKEKAIERAITTAGKQPAMRKKKARTRVNFGFRRVVLALACAAAAVFAIVYFVNQSTPNISLKVAAMQSGIDAKYPSYVPRDYNLSDITSENGKITLNFRNNATSESFTIVEEASSWDSNALMTNYVKSTYGDDYTQVVEQGLTIFISGGNACWVNGGTVYKLKTTSGSLTKKQIKAIAVGL